LSAIKYENETVTVALIRTLREDPVRDVGMRKAVATTNDSDDSEGGEGGGNVRSELDALEARLEDEGSARPYEGGSTDRLSRAISHTQSLTLITMRARLLLATACVILKLRRLLESGSEWGRVRNALAEARINCSSEDVSVEDVVGEEFEAIQNLYDMRNVKELLEAALLSGGAVGRAGAEGQSSNGIGEWSTPIVVAGEVSIDQLKIGIQQALALGAKTAQIRMLLGGAKTMLSLRQAQLDDDWGEVARLIETIDDADAAQSARTDGEGDVSMPALCYDELNLARAECEHREATMSSALADIAPFEVTTPTTSNVLLKQKLSIEYVEESLIGCLVVLIGLLRRGWRRKCVEKSL
jgi:hypothetical protein